MDVWERYYKTQFTTGDWATEAASAAAFDRAILQAGLWTRYAEVRGTLTQPRTGQVDKAVRIDRILTPTTRLLDLGWSHGAIGVEIKRSGEKIGPPIAQAMDYTRAVFTLQDHGSIKIALDWVFVWPMAKQGGTVASILSQQRVGSAHSDDWTVLQLKAGESNVISISHDGEISIGSGANGRKVGSR